MQEFSVIEKFFTGWDVRDGVTLGIGDDGAILDTSTVDELVTVTDTFIVGVHCPVGTSAFHIGWKALAVNLSDMAAMFAKPKWATLNLSLSRLDEEWLSGFSEGFKALAQKYQVALVGGDTTVDSRLSTDKQVGAIVSVTIFGSTISLRNGTKFASQRAGAKVGDDIWVTGQIGLAGLGLRHLLGQRTADDDQLRKLAVNRLNQPTPRLDCLDDLAHCINACIDVSDGLLADIQHICQSSWITCHLDLERIPAVSSGDCEAILQDVTAGDDYELVFTCDSKYADFINTLDLQIVKIGEIKAREDKDLEICYQGKEIEFDGVYGFTH